MKLTKIYALILLICAGALTSCMEEPDFYKVWDGLEVEFDLSTLPQNGPLENFIRTSETQVDDYNVQVNLVGAPQANDVNITFEIDEEATTAIAGVHYNLNTTSVTIPAGQNIAQIPVQVLTGNIDPSETPNLVLRIISADDIKISANYNQVTVRIRVICPSDLEGTYQFANGNKVTVERIGTGLYKVNNLNAMGGYFAASNIISGLFSDVCDELTLYGQTEFDVQWRGKGVYDHEAGTITWESIEDLTHGGGFKRNNVVMTRLPDTEDDDE